MAVTDYKLGLGAGVIAAITLAFTALVQHQALSGTAAVDWIGKTPAVSKISDLSALPALANYDCTNTNLTVVRGIQKVVEKHCTLPTAMGLVELEGKVAQTVGYSEAYPLQSAIGGNPVTIPVPNQPAALAMRPYPNGAGVTYELYKNFYGHLQFDPLATEQKLKIVKPPENIFRYGDGQQMQFNPYTLTFPGHGRYMMVDTIFNGFMLMDMRTLAMRPVADSLVRANGTELLRASTAIDSEGRFAAIAYGSPGFWGTPYFKVIDVASCSGGFNSNSRATPVFSCPTVNVRPQLEPAIPNLVEIRNVRFVNERTMTFVATSGSAADRKIAKYSMTAGGQSVSLVEYLALGDSYISGEGAYGYRAETDTERNRCHQSTFSYPYLLGGSMSSFASVACSGAKMHNVNKTGEQEFQVYEPKPSDQEELSALESYTPGYVLQNRFVTRDNPHAITISIGGNDIGFGQVLEKCVHPLKNVGEAAQTQHTCYATYEDRLELVNLISRQLPKLRSLYADMRNGGTHTRRVYVVGYPQVAKAGGDCGLNVQMNADEVKFAADLVSYLNSVIKQAADEAGVVYVDTQQAFDGRRLCEGDGSNSAMNGFTVSKRSWGGYGFEESFHPNKSGHQLLAAAIAAQTSNLTRPMPEPVAEAPFKPIDPNLPVLQNAPVSGRTVRHVQLMERGEAVVEKGSQLDMVINAQTYNTKPDSVYEASLYSTPISLGSFRADAEGNLTVSFSVPAAAEAGFHTVHVRGNDVFGKPVDLQRTVYVAASAQDYDGDGLVNEADTCALAAQSGLDRDADGTDDACDSVIGAAPVAPPEPAGIIWRDDAVLSIEIQTTSGQ